MSLNVPAALLERAESGPVDDAEFVACVRDSLPYAWTVINGVVSELRTGGGDFADHSVPPPSSALSPRTAARRQGCSRGSSPAVAGCGASCSPPPS